LAKAKKYKIKGYYSIPNDVDQIKAAIKRFGPVTGLVDATTWQLFKGNIFTDNTKCKNGKLNHVINVVGWNVVSGIPIWIIKNSWGTGWGHKGYAYIKIGDDNVCGIQTGVATAFV